MFASVSSQDKQAKQEPSFSVKKNIQAKLKVSQPGDMYEQEADRIAEQVINMSGPISSRTIDNQVSRKCDMCEEEKIYRNAENDLQISDDVASNIESLKGGENSLDYPTKSFMESRFGFDFSKVRIHTDDIAARSAESVNALAYTVGKDIVFGEGQYQPNTLEGKRLLAHELTHVVQQDDITVPRQLSRAPTVSQLDERGKKKSIASKKEDDPKSLLSISTEDLIILFMSDDEWTFLPDESAAFSKLWIHWNHALEDELSRRIQKEREQGKVNHLETLVNLIDAMEGPETWRNQLMQIVEPQLYETQMPKQEFIDKVVEAISAKDKAYTKRDMYLRNLSISYREAWKIHTKTLKDAQESSKSLLGDFILEMILAFVPGGAGGVIGSILKKKAAGDFIADGIKDLAKWGMRSGGKSFFENRQDPLADKAGLKSFPKDPADWVDDIFIQNDIEKLKVENTIHAWIHSANTDDPKFIRNFDPTEKIDSTLKINGIPMIKLEPEDRNELEKKFEMGFWKEWLEKYAFKTTGIAYPISEDEDVLNALEKEFPGIGRPSWMWIASDKPEESVPSKIKDRFRSLGLDPDEFITANSKMALKQQTEEFYDSVVFYFEDNSHVVRIKKHEYLRKLPQYSFGMRE